MRERHVRKLNNFVATDNYNSKINRSDDACQVNMLYVYVYMARQKVMVANCVEDIRRKLRKSSLWSTSGANLLLYIIGVGGILLTLDNL